MTSQNKITKIILGTIIFSSILIAGSTSFADADLVKEAKNFYENSPEKITSFTLPFTTEPIASAVDTTGNMAFAWADNSDTIDYCRYIYFQLYNYNGIPITGHKELIKTCYIDDSYKDPKIIFTKYGLAIVYYSYVYDGSQSNPNIQIQFYNTTTNTISPPITINDFSIYDYNDLKSPQLAIENEDKNVIGITWVGCPDATCAEEKIMYQNINLNGNRPNPNNKIISENSTNYAVANPRIADSGTLFMITWTQFDNDETIINTRTVNAHDSNLMTSEIEITNNNFISNPEQYVFRSDVVGNGIFPPAKFTIENDEAKWQNNFFIVYDDLSNIDNSKSIYLKKISCITTVSLIDFQQSDSCSIATKNSKDVIIRINTTTPNNIMPAIAKSQKQLFKDDQDDGIPRLDNIANTITVTWVQADLEKAEFPIYNLIAQNYDSNLKKLGNHFMIHSGINDVDTTYTLSKFSPNNFLINFRSLVECPNANWTCDYIDDIRGGNNNYKNQAELYNNINFKVGTNIPVNPPTNLEQQFPQTALNSDGKYVIVYEQLNDDNSFSSFYTLYDNFGNSIIANQPISNTLTGDQIFPHVKFFNEDKNSVNYGKFIISWQGEGSGDNDGIFYRIFKADGTPDTTETLINTNINQIQSGHDLNVGKYGQIAIIYAEENADSITNDIILYYNNNGNIIRQNIANSTEILLGPKFSPKVALNPKADGSTGLAGQTKFAIGWNTEDISHNFSTYFQEGYLQSSSTINLLATPTNIGESIKDIEGGYNDQITTKINNANDNFFYGAIIFDNNQYNSKAKIFNSNIILDIPNKSTRANELAIDPATGNIAIIGAINNTYEDLWDKQKIVLNETVYLNPFYPLYGGSDEKNKEIVIANDDFSVYGRIIDVSTNYYATALQNIVGGGFIPFELLRIFIKTDTFGVYPSQQLFFVNSTEIDNFQEYDLIQGNFSGASGTVRYKHQSANPGESFLIVELDNGSPFFDYIDTITNQTDFANVDSTVEGYILNFYEEGWDSDNHNKIYTPDFLQSGEIVQIISSYQVFIKTNDVFPPYDPIMVYAGDKENHNDVAFYPIITLNTLTFTDPNAINGLAETTISWTEESTKLYPSKFNDYGQNVMQLSISYNTSSEDINEQRIITAFNTYISPFNIKLSHHPDYDGIYQQIFVNPYNLGESQNSSPITTQQINPGGKYIQVPELITFSQNLEKQQTYSVNFYDINNNCITVTDLDGSEFDLTVSMTDLTNNTNINIPKTISNSNFEIENNDGIRDEIAINQPFSNLNDVSLDPSTNINQHATLNNVQTLLNKNNKNTGSWKICPKLIFNVPANAPIGIANGSLTFTII